MRTRPADAADENETAGQEGYSETFHTFTSMNKELERYIEREIIPRYEDFDAAHRTDHVRTVIAQSLELAAHYDADADMVYTVAAYHETAANGTTSTPDAFLRPTPNCAAGSPKNRSR